MSDHLVGAYGMFWKREEVDWNPGPGTGSWQLLGYKGQNRPGLRVCDFRYAAGFYMLWDDFRPVYVGLARGDGGIGARLRVHHMNKEDWSRFSWFSFDDVIDSGGWEGWSEPKVRNQIRTSSTETVVRECEALLITVMGTAGTAGSQNKMGFLTGEKWTQVSTQDYGPGRVCRKVDADGFSDQAIFDEWD